ncbi:MAG: GntR family transcriptional regulator [Melioribacteraceae bacterium]|nr:GntR family transcriptional regulator [Melioribacteraceae bacterium]
MILNLTDLSDEPLQSQIYRQVRAMILANEISPGTLLPSIRGLAREQRVSVITVQRGYEMLEREGLIISRRGKGFFVSEVQTSTKKDLARHHLIEKIAPIIKIAKDEGMSEEEIKNEINKLLDKEN